MNTKSLDIDSNKRLYSLDALRGFDMFWIIGGGVLNWVHVLAEQVHHAEWNGFYRSCIPAIYVYLWGCYSIRHYFET